MLGRILRCLTRSNGETERHKDTHPKYTPMTKHYVFNETGNIMLCATADSIRNFDDEIKDSFIDISVFFTAMTKAIHSTINPITGKPFSIYNYQAVKNILNQSGLFIETNVEEGMFRSRGVGAPMGKAFVQKVLNRDFSESQLNFSKGMFNGMGYQKVSSGTWKGLDQEQQKLCRIGNIFFIGELLLGLPQTSAILVNVEPYSIDEKTKEMDSDRQNIFNLGITNERRHEPKNRQRFWKFKKRTYLFVPPKFFKNNIYSLKDSDSQDFEDYVEFLSGRLSKLSETRIETKSSD